MRMIALLLAAAGAAAAVPVCSTCEDGAAAVTVADEEFTRAGVELWQCPACGQYFFNGGWHGAFELEAEKKRLARRADGIPDACPACGGPLDETYAYVLTTETAKKPSYICYRCWTVVFPDGTWMAPEDIQAFEAERRKVAEKDRVAELVREYGWDEARATRIVAGDVRVGDEVNAVREAWGPPARAERTISPDGIRERWLYPGGKAAEFKDGVATALTE